MKESKQVALRAANIARLRQMLTDLADASGTVRGRSIWNLTLAFNRRYQGETLRLSETTIRTYLDSGVAEGWLTLNREQHGTRKYIITVIATQDGQDSAA